jgi:aryl-phospho-beta-D-glucosidase BglC (GH1 family)
MRGELSNGLPSLCTSENRIVQADSGEPVLLRGLNRSGLEYSEPKDQGFAASAGITAEEIEWIAREWRANIFRIPFNQDWALRGRAGKSGEDYLSDLDRVISWAAQNGAYTLLDLQWLSMNRVHGPGKMMVPPLPNPETPELWKMLAGRYREEPAVLFDLFNEPHDRLPEDPYPLFRHDGSEYPPDYATVSMTEWQPWALRLIDTIRDEHPSSVIFVSGMNWAYDLRGFPLHRENLVYSTHVYPSKGSNWESAFGYLSRFMPVFAGEFGGVEKDLVWGERLLHFFDARGMGWTAWSWSDYPHMAHDYEPTVFGSLVQDRLCGR